MKRRKFLKYTGLGLGLAVGGAYLTRHSWRRVIFRAAEDAIPPYVGSTAPELWIQVLPDNQIILHSSKVEMGQGSFTGLAQLAAEELEVATEKIKVVHAQTASGNIDELSTGGSLSIATLWTPLREMAATMRELLRNEAAKKLGVSTDELTLADGVISARGQSLTYGEVVADLSEWDFPATPTLKDPKDFKQIGKPVPRVDLRDKVIGASMFGMDVDLPGMVYASVLRPEKVDAKLKSCDTTAARQMPGVIDIVQEVEFVGVVAETHYQAEQARKALKVEWEVNEEWNLAKIRTLTQVGSGNLTVVQKEGDAEEMLANGDVFTLNFSSPIGAHAQLEPNGATAEVKDGKATIWLSTQVPAITHSEVAKRLGFSKKDVNIIPQYLGGGFGRRLHTPNAMEAAVMAQAVGRPVKSFFDRQQEFQNDTFRPPTHHVMRGKLDANGKIAAIEHSLCSGDVAFDSALMPPGGRQFLGADIGAIRGGAIQYRAIPNICVNSWHVELPFATSWWRSLGLLANTFAIESFLDEMALQSGQNPVDFRLAHLQKDTTGRRLKNVIEAVAKRAGYTDEVREGRAMGFAASVDTGSPCAQVFEVSMEDGELKIHKVTVALDCGIAVNPDQVRAQVEGSVCMGISATLYEQMSLEDNTLLPTIYGPYQMALMRDTPKEIDVVLIQGADVAGPVGEPPLGPVGAALGNAIRRLTGERWTDLPLLG